jgi:hypothetical protein
MCGRSGESGCDDARAHFDKGDVSSSGQQNIVTAVATGVGLPSDTSIEHLSDEELACSTGRKLSSTKPMGESRSIGRPAKEEFIAFEEQKARPPVISSLSG